VKPVIGITCDVHQPAPGRSDWWYQVNAYFRAVRKAGGLPLMLPLLESEEEAAAVIARLDGLLLSGGGDPDPALFGEDPIRQLGTIQPERDTAELSLARAALTADLPLLGICRGSQVLAVAGGGTMIQDIPAQVPGAIKHRQDAPRWYPTHRVEVVEGSLLSRLLGGPELRVNSSHHQAVRDVPAGWVVSARAPDGVVEAIEIPQRRFALAVQWHPEAMYDSERPAHGELFRALVEAASGGGR
jgi:putative glutamine amidotransferase